jgi:hypothetical protein
MKSKSRHHRWGCRRLASFGAGVACLTGALLFAQEPKADRPRDKLQALERKVEDLKAEGRHDEAKKLQAEIAELRGHADERAKAARKEASAGDERRRDLKQKLHALQARAKELRADGNQDEAEDVQRQIEKLERELGGRVEREVRIEKIERDGREPGAPGARRERPPEGIAETQRRLNHLVAAIENLHAAGLPEPANELNREADRLREQLHAYPRPGGPERHERAGELEGLRQEVRELRQAVQELRTRLETLARERR